MINAILLFGICVMVLWYDIRQSVLWARYYRYYVPFLEKFAYWYWVFSLMTIFSYYN